MPWVFCTRLVRGPHGIWALTFPLQTIRLYHYVLTTVRDPTDGRRRRRTNDDGRTDVAPNTFFFFLDFSRVQGVRNNRSRAKCHHNCSWSPRPPKFNVGVFLVILTVRNKRLVLQRASSDQNSPSSSLVGRSSFVVVGRSVGHRRRSSVGRSSSSFVVVFLRPTNIWNDPNAFWRGMTGWPWLLWME